MKNSAFTLIELLVVLVIVGVFAVLAFSSYFNQIEKARSKQALETLKVMSDAQKYYFTNFNIYTSNLNDLSFSSPVGGKIYWTFSIPSANSNSFLLEAQRNSGTEQSRTITLDQTGTWGGTHLGTPNN